MVVGVMIVTMLARGREVGGGGEGCACAQFPLHSGR